MDSFSYIYSIIMNELSNSFSNDMNQIALRIQEILPSSQILDISSDYIKLLYQNRVIDIRH